MREGGQTKVEEEERRRKKRRDGKSVLLC